MQLASCLEGVMVRENWGWGVSDKGRCNPQSSVAFGAQSRQGSRVAGKTKMRPDKLDCGPARNTPIDNKANLVNWMSGLRSLACGTNYNQTMGQ